MSALANNRQLESEDPSLVSKFTESAAPIDGKYDSLLDLTVGVLTLWAAFAILAGLAASAIGLATIAGFLALLRRRVAQEPDMNRRMR